MIYSGNLPGVGQLTALKDMLVEGDAFLQDRTKFFLFEKLKIKQDDLLRSKSRQEDHKNILDELLQHLEESEVAPVNFTVQDARAFDKVFQDSYFSKSVEYKLTDLKKDLVNLEERSTAWSQLSGGQSVNDALLEQAMLHLFMVQSKVYKVLEDVNKAWLQLRL